MVQNDVVRVQSMGAIVAMTPAAMADSIAMDRVELVFGNVVVPAVAVEMVAVFDAMVAVDIAKHHSV